MISTVFDVYGCCCSGIGDFKSPGSPDSEDRKQFIVHKLWT
jgi:hypothetical protein